MDVIFFGLYAQLYGHVDVIFFGLYAQLYGHVDVIFFGLYAQLYGHVDVISFVYMPSYMVMWMSFFWFICPVIWSCGCHFLGLYAQ